MSKQTKIYIIQFFLFAILFLIIRTAIAHFFHLTGLWLPFISALITSFLAPQFKILKNTQQEEVYVAWLFYRKPKKVNFL